MPSTPANTLSSAFEDIIKKEDNISKVAEELSKNEIIQTKLSVEEKTPSDYLSGFNEQITNFNDSYVIQPIIGSIPFIAYVFETSNPSELEEELKTKANPRWNICVEADETVIKVVDNYVFFVMSPKSFEE